ncbi:MAG: isoamylase early set domain-containing protein [Acidimicrobiales bacterium]
MIQCEAKRGTPQVKVTFILADDGYGVAVVGDFNGWDPTAAPMAKKGAQRVATMVLAPGRRYGFRYLCEDGKWLNDEAADAYEPNAFGVDNSVLDLTGVAGPRPAR